MNVPEVVQTTRTMIVHMATLGPDSQSHHDSPSGPPSVSAAGGASVSTRPRPPSNRWSRPRESENHSGLLIPNVASRLLTAPELAKMNRKTTLMATELVTEGK